MQAVVMVAGAFAQAVAWWLVGARDVWRVMPVVLGTMGVAALIVRPPIWAGEVTTIHALGLGAASGVVLYAATRVVVSLATRWAALRRAVRQSYAKANTVTRATSLVLSLGVMVPAEELFWRGLFRGRLQDALGGAAAAAALSWLAYVCANVTSRSLPILAGAAVGGALWTWLAWWSGGVLAGLASHILWTGLMLALPPGAGRRATTA